MTEDQTPPQSQAASDSDASSQSPPPDDPAAQAERIVSDGQRIHDRVRDTVLRSVRNGKLDLDELRAVVNDVVEGTTRGLDEVVPAQRRSVLRQVFEGMSDALAVTAGAAKLALSEAAGRGQSFAKEDLKKTTENLRQMEKTYLDTVWESAKKTGGEAADVLKELVNHARNTGTSIRPSVEEALRVAAKHPIELAGEAASAGVHLTRQGVGALMHAMGGFLDAAGEVIAGESKKKGD